MDDLGQKEAPFRPPLGGHVVAEGRAHFYSAPDRRCQMKEFLVKGDTVVIYVPYQDWYYVTYINAKTNVETQAWLPASVLKIGGTMGHSY